MDPDQFVCVFLLTCIVPKLHVLDDRVSEKLVDLVVGSPQYLAFSEVKLIERFEVVEERPYHRFME
jgi:hypothetical protein